jgi:hypothetical protein
VTTTPRPPRLLLLSTALLAVAGVALLSMPHSQGPTAPATASTAHAGTNASSAAAPLPASDPALSTTPSATPAASTQSAVESALPPHGEGRAGDAVIQKALEAAWPADLPPDDEGRLLAAGRALLRADATGKGRETWPLLFPSAGQHLAPAFATARFRIQAAIARRDGADDQAVVHLVWAGADRGGTFTDGRITDWHFTRSTSKKGASTWLPQPRP